MVATINDPAQHGFVLVGTKVIYASHMPKFTPPYDYQVVCEVKLDNDAYRSLRIKYGTSAQFTVHTDPLSLSDLRPGSDGRPTVKYIQGQLFLGRFARDGDSLGKVTITVQRTLEFIHVEMTRRQDLSYLVFGREPELFLSHRIITPPDFDQILRIQRTGPPIESLATDCRAEFVAIPAQENHLDTRLLPGQHVNAVLAGAETLPLQVLAELYLETDDLMS